MRRLLSLAAVCLLFAGCAAVQRQTATAAQSASPALLAALSEGEGRVAILWMAPEKSKGIEFYRLEFARAGQPFESLKQYNAKAVNPGLQTERVEDMPAGQLLSFRMTSLLSSSGGKESSVVLPLILGEAKKECLVVEDGPFRSPERLEERSRSLAVYGESLKSLDQPFDSCLSDLLPMEGQDRPALEGYKKVLWTCGLDAKNPLTPEERSILREYLDNEGNLFLCGAGLGKALAGPDSTPDELEFYQNYLKAFSEPGWESGAQSARLLRGAKGQKHFEKLRARISGKSRQEQHAASVIEPFGGSDAALIYDGIEGASAAAVAYVGNFGKPNVFCRLVHLALPWESLPAAEGRTEVLKAVLDYLENAGPLKYVSIVQSAVTDSRTGKALSGVTVHLLGGANYLGTPVKATTDKEGKCTIIALEGTYHILCEKEGYRPVRYRNRVVRKGKVTNLNGTLDPQ